MSQKSSVNRSARVRARRVAVQALYQIAMSESLTEDVIDEFIQCRKEIKKADIDYFKKLLFGVAEQRVFLDQQLTSLLDRKLEELDLIEKVILRIGLYELNFHTELPYRVILNESIELAKIFGAEKSHKYINGVLDKATQISRAAEFSH